MTSALAADPAGCSPNDDVRTALAAWLGGDREGASTALREAAAAFGCSGQVSPDTLARYWLVEGAVLHAAGDKEAMQDNFAAARRVAPEVWLPDLGAPLRALWEESSSPAGEGSLVLQPPAGGRPVWVDGTPLQGGDVPAGLHLVQVGAASGEVAEFSAWVWVGPGVSAVVESGLAEVPGNPQPGAAQPVNPQPAPAPQPQPQVEVPRPDRPPREGGAAVRLHALVGASSALGEELVSGDQREPGVKVALPLELGLGVVVGPAWLRMQAGGAWLVGGEYLASGADGTMSLPARVDLGLAALFEVGPVNLGLAGGAQWPSRLAGRAVLGFSPVGPMWVELRPGANLPTQRQVEPAGELLVGVRL